MNSTEAQAIAQTMVKQFGGRSSMVMIGGQVNSYGVNKGNSSIIESGSEGDVYVDIRFKAKSAKINGKSPNALRIIYNVSSDTYSMVLYRIHGTNITTQYSVDMIYCDMIKSVFEDNTKLYLTL